MIERYGNREFDAANTTTLGSCTQAVCNPDINTANNRFSSGQGYAYDQNGNVTQDAEGKRFGYDAENHQKEFFNASNSGSTPDAAYSYDGEGKRVKKVSSLETTVFVYNASGQLVAEYSTQISQTPRVSYLTTDHLGSPRVISDQIGTVTHRKDYSAFGEETISAQRQSALGYTAAGDELRKGYTGYEKDRESGLDFAQARYYNSTHGRYTSIDPLTASASIRNPQTFNRYSYVLNSPYKYTDPLGLMALDTACGGSCPGSFMGIEGDGYFNSKYGDVWKKQQAEAADPPPTQGGWINSGGNEWKWVNQCPTGQSCYSAIAGVNENNGITILGSRGAEDITIINANKNGAINLNEVASHHDANFLIAKDQQIPEEYLSPVGAIALFNVSRVYGDHYTKDGKLEFTAGVEASGNGCIKSDGS